METKASLRPMGKLELSDRGHQLFELNVHRKEVIYDVLRDRQSTSKRATSRGS